MKEMNEERFTGKALIYDEYRPSYPPEVVTRILKEISSDEPPIAADVGSGTGKFARLLLQRGCKVFCVEPNADMRAIAEKNLSGYDGFVSVAASAEHTSLPDRSVDLVTAAQSFHWFDRAAFASECERILRKGGKAALIWNGYDTSSDKAIALKELCAAYCPGFKGFSGGARTDRSFDDFFSDYETNVFNGEIAYDLRSFTGRCMSSSYSPSYDTPAHAQFRNALERFFDSNAKDGILIMPLITVCHCGSVRSRL